MPTASFGVWDYVVFGLMLASSIGIGIYHAVKGRNQSTSEYLTASHTMTFLPVALSLIATFQSSIMMLGTPADSYVYGIGWLLGELGSATGGILEIILALAFLKRLNLSTPFEYLERRFKSRGLRILANVASCIHYVSNVLVPELQLLYCSVVLYGQGVALQAVTGFSIYGSIILTASTAVIYTAIGGLRAVIWTDVLQSIIMFTGLLVVTIKGTVEAGGASEVWTRASESGRLDFSLDPDPTVRYTVWNLYFGRIIGGFGFLINPATLQRISSTKSLKDARRAVLITTPGFSVLIFMALAEGIVAYAYYAYKRCDPLASDQISTPNQIIPFMILDLFKHLPGMSGLFLAALSSASLSTISSCISAISIITWYDLVKPCFPNMSDFRGLVISKSTVVASGMIASLMAVVFTSTSSNTLNQIYYTLEAVARHPVVGLFYVGALFSFVNTKGAITGLVTGIIVMGWLVIGSMFSSSENHTPYYPLGSTDQCQAFNLSLPLNLTTPIHTTSDPRAYNVTSPKSGLDFFYNLSYTLFTTLAVTVVVVVGTVASLVTGGWKNPADPELVIQKADIWCPSFSQRRKNVINDGPPGSRKTGDIVLTELAGQMCNKESNDKIDEEPKETINLIS